jgi:hypothetical protein
MIIKIFKIESMELCVIRHKTGLLQFIRDELGLHLAGNMTIKQLMRFLPVEQYYRVK